MAKQLVALEFYSGIGGLNLALKRSNLDAAVVRAFDWDEAACRVYEANHGPRIATKVDILSLTASSLASFQAELWLLSPACQPYTVLNRHANGSSDSRAKSFLHLVEHVLPDLVAMNAHPTHLLMENVAGFELSAARQLLLSTLRSLGYVTAEFLVTPLQFGIPNSRLRYYLLAKMSPLVFSRIPNMSTDVNRVWRHIPGHSQVNHDWVDPRSQRCDEPESDLSPHSVNEIRLYLDKYLDENGSYAIPDRMLKKWGRLFDIVLPSSRRTCCFTRGYTHLVERSGSILQMNEELDTSEIFDEFFEAQSNDRENAVRILLPLRLRYFSPEELLRLFNFDFPLGHVPNSLSEKYRCFVWPSCVTTKTKYRLIGNSVNVTVVMDLINFLFE